MAVRTARPCQIGPLDAGARESDPAERLKADPADPGERLKADPAERLNG